MCEQLKVLKKIRKEGKMNGFGVELAEAQAKDFMAVVKRLDLMEEEQKRQGIEQARQGGMIESIFNRLNSPVEQERIQGAYWRALVLVCKSKVFWLVVVAILFFVAMTGSEIKHLLGWLPTGV